jgi:hypothetical protein
VAGIPWTDGSGDEPSTGSAGRTDAAAAAILDAVEGGRHGVAVYPRMLGRPHRFPGLGRRYSRHTAKHADLPDETVRFAGSVRAGIAQPGGGSLTA